MDNPILREWLTQPNGLASQLSAIRIRAGISGSALARRLEWVHTKVSRIQNGRQIPTAEEIRAWTRACDAAEEADKLVALLEQVSTQRLTWRHWLAAADGRIQNAYNELFRQSTKVSMFENESIPKQFDLLMTETTLLSGPATADVLVAQLHEVLRIMELPNVRIGVVPLKPGLPVVIVSPFSIHEVISGDVIVIGEVLHGELPNLADSLDLYQQALADLWAAAVEGQDAQTLITSAIYQHRTPA